MVLAREASQILGLYMNGLELGEIEKETGLSLSTVRAFLNGFDDEVLGTLRSFRELSSEFDDTPALMDAMEGAQLSTELSRFGLDASDLESYIEFCDKVSSGSPEIIEDAVRFSDLEDETGVPYDEMLDRYQTLIVEVESLRDQLDKLRDQRAELEEEVGGVEERLERRLEETGMTLDRLRQVENLREELEVRGNDLEDLEELAVFFDSCEEMGFEPRTVSRMVDLHSRISKFGADPSDISTYLRRNAKLDDLGFTIETASILAERLNELESDPGEAAAKLAGRFRESELLEKQLAELRDRRENLRVRVEELEESVGALENEVSSVQEETSRLDERREQLLDREVQLKARVEERSEEVEAMEERVEELAASQSLVKDIKALEEREKELREVIEDLETAREGSVDADLDTLYLKVKEQRDELFGACVDLFQESSTALVMLISSGDSILEELPPRKLGRLYRRMQVLKSQDSYGVLTRNQVEAAESMVLERVDPEQLSDMKDVEGFEDLGELTVL
ncbi:MAG: Chromosome partition protein Smc [Methanonatronarchaeales archaeon]|nr:Chromosome partition protein Smc [Methanonatronarchaeales archaeon]